MKLLVGIDFSKYTDTIVEKTQEIAKALSAKVWLLHVAQPEPDFVGFDADPKPERDAVARQFHLEHTEIQTIADKLRMEGLDTTALLVQGATAKTILKQASKLGADIIIVGSHGRGALRQLLVGSTSEAVLRHAECPVIVIPVHGRT